MSAKLVLNKEDINKLKKDQDINKKDHYINWRWNKVFFYQSLFVVFLTSTILMIINLINPRYVYLRIAIVLLFALISFFLYKKMIACSSKPVFTAENVSATIEGEPIYMRKEDNKGQYGVEISNVTYKRQRRENVK